MASITIYSGLNSWSLEELLTREFDWGGPASMMPTSVSGTSGGFSAEMTGAFTYSGGVLSGGTMTSLTVGYLGSPLISVADVSLDIEEIAYGTAGSVQAHLFDGADTLRSFWDEGQIFDLRGGNDRIELGRGDDVVDGGAGTDTFVLGTALQPGRISVSGNMVVIDSAKGEDRLRDVEIVEFRGAKVSFQVGGGNDDRLDGDANAGAHTDFLYGGGGDDRLIGGEGNDRLFGNSGADNLLGDAGADRLRGGGGDDRLTGGEGNDRLFGQRGADELIGGEGDDWLSGGGGGDVLTGGAGDDVLRGGAGRDVFLFNEGHGDDRIVDFRIGFDIIEIGGSVAELSDLGFSQRGSDVLIDFADVTVLVEDVTVAGLRDAANFDF